MELTNGQTIKFAFDYGSKQSSITVFKYDNEGKLLEYETIEDAVIREDGVTRVEFIRPAKAIEIDRTNTK